MFGKIFITGTGGSGKDFLRKKFQKRGFKFGIQYTTRPMRDGEQDGVDYHFIPEDKFILMILNNEFVEHTQHRGWYYGLSTDEYKTNDVFIISPKSFVHFDQEIKEAAFKIYLDINEDVRRKRLSERDDADSSERRISSDKHDVSLLNMSEFDLIIRNEDF